MSEEIKTQPTRRHERIYDLTDPNEAKLKADNDRKRAARAKRKDEELAQDESISQMWKRNSVRFASEDPKIYADLQARHDEIMALESEVDEIVAGVAAGKRAGIAHDGNTEDWPNIFPMPDECYADVKASVEQNGSLNYGAAERTEGFRPPFGAKHSDTEDWQHRFYGFHLKIKSDTLPRIREALILYALGTGDPNLNWAIVDDAVDCWLAAPYWSPNSSEIQKLITNYRGEFKLPSRNRTPEPEPFWRAQGFDSYRDFIEHQQKKERDRKFLDDVLKHNQLPPSPAHPSDLPPTFFQSQVGS